MEWGRRCYSSAWRLFKDDNKEVLVKGRYYFSPANTPHAPFHQLFSLDMTQTSWYSPSALGEVEGYRVWDKGEPPSKLPLNRIVGTPDCLRNGATRAVPFKDLINGFVPQCFTPIPVDDSWPIIAEFAMCIVQKSHAKIIKWLYERDENSIRAYLSTWLGNDVTVAVNLRDGEFPCTCIVRGANWSAAIAAGTESNLHLALQAIEAVNGPQNFGQFGTIANWINGGTQILEDLEANGYQPGDKVFFCGHSYGAVSAMTLAVRMRIARPEMQIRYLLFGSPKPGDMRFRRFVETMQGVALEARNDPVPWLPPSFDFSIEFLLTYAPGLLTAFNQWIPTPYRLLLETNGQLRFFYQSDIIASQLETIVQAVLNGDPLPVIEPHLIENYLASTLARCPDAPPVPPCVALFAPFARFRMEFICPAYPFIDGRSFTDIEQLSPYPILGTSASLSPGFMFGNISCNDLGPSDVLSGSFTAGPAGVGDYSFLATNVPVDVSDWPNKLTCRFTSTDSEGHPSLGEIVVNFYPVPYDTGTATMESGFTFDAIGTPTTPPAQPTAELKLKLRFEVLL